MSTSLKAVICSVIMVMLVAGSHEYWVLRKQREKISEVDRAFHDAYTYYQTGSFSDVTNKFYAYIDRVCQSSNSIQQYRDVHLMLHVAHRDVAFMLTCISNEGEAINEFKKAYEHYKYRELRSGRVPSNKSSFAYDAIKTVESRESRQPPNWRQGIIIDSNVVRNVIEGVAK